MIQSKCPLTQLSFSARNIFTLESADANVRLMLSGSRGVGAVSSWSEGITTLELLDLEEDEEVDEKENGESEEDEE